MSEAISITVEEGGDPEGPVSIDFDLVPGDHGRRLSGFAAAGQIHALELHVTGVPQIDGWSVDLQYDHEQLRYLNGSFRAGSFISDLDVEETATEGLLSLTGRASAEGIAGSGDGPLGVVSFEILPAFEGTAAVTVVQVLFFRVDDVPDSRIVHSPSSIVADPVTGVLTGDFDGNGEVWFEDLFLFADAFGGTNPLYDLDRNGTVDMSDFNLLADNFGSKVPSG